MRGAWMKLESVSLFFFQESNYILEFGSIAVVNTREGFMGLQHGRPVHGILPFQCFEVEGGMGGCGFGVDICEAMEAQISDQFKIPGAQAGDGQGALRGMLASGNGCSGDDAEEGAVHRGTLRKVQGKPWTVTCHHFLEERTERGRVLITGSSTDPDEDWV